jgi:hypothetical protein
MERKTDEKIILFGTSKTKIKATKNSTIRPTLENATQNITKIPN